MKRNNEAKLALLLLAVLAAPACASRIAPGVLPARAARSTLQTFASVAGFNTPLIDQDSPGNDISFDNVWSVQECADICSANANCAGFDYIASGASAPNQPLCIPKHTIRSTLQPFGSGNVGALYVKASGEC